MIILATDVASLWITADPDANNDENDNRMPGGSGNTPDPDVSTPESGKQPDQSSMSGKVDTYINFSSIEPDSLSFHFGNGKDEWFTESDLLHDFVQENPDHSFAEQVDAVLNGTANRYNDLKVCDTPDILLQVGCEQLPMLYTQRHLREALKPKNDHTHAHGLEVDQIKRIPKLLEEPVMIMDSVSRNDSIVVVTSEVDKDNNPVIVSIHPNGNGSYEMEKVDSNFITSIYGRDNFETFLKRVVEAPDSAKFKGIKTVKNHDETAFYACFGVIENFTHQVKLQAVIILPINNVISMQFSHFCQSNFADSGKQTIFSIMIKKKVKICSVC